MNVLILKNVLLKHIILIQVIMIHLMIFIGQHLNVNYVKKYGKKMEVNKENLMINLGDRVRCKITGYSGIAVSRTEHLYSSNVEIGVEQETLKDGFPVQ